ncbi:MAG: hypothetical protein IT222_11655 [Crocinitomix sp.]|jgi:hypothetical protein|nr:hypothetical protein [Crocinitomix sp.]
MSETKALLEVLDAKVTDLLSNLNELNNKVIEQGEEISALKGQLSQKNDENALLNTEIELLKQAAPKENQEDLKFKIGEMVKEIDRCISLLKV